MKNWSYSDKVPEGKDVKDTKMLSTTASEKFATGTNTQERYVGKHKPFGPLGAKGHP